MPKSKPKKDLEAFTAEQDEVKFAEHEKLKREKDTLRKALTKTKQENKALADRLDEYEHPSVVAIEKLLAKKKVLTRTEIAKELNVELDVAEAALQDMEARGYNVVDGTVSRIGARPRVTVEHFYGPEVRFGVVSDVHIGNHHSLEEELHEAYAVFEKEGITEVYAPGNLIDGEKTYRGQEYEINVMGVDNVVANLARVWPKVTGITTHHIASSTCHEGYYFKSAGVLIGKLFDAARSDFNYLGQDEADIVVHDSEVRPTLRIVHPGGGASYADSYRPQKIVESYSGGEKPMMLVIGHYHKCGMYDIRDVMVINAGCLERQTPFMRKHSLVARMGFWVVEAKFTEEGSLRRFNTEWFKYHLGSRGQVLKSFSV